MGILDEIKKNEDVISAAKDVEQEFLAKKAEKEKKKEQPKEAEEPEPQVLDLIPDVASSLGVNPVENINSAQLDIAGEMQNDFIPDVARIDEAKITESLTEEDIKYLSLKWGLLYKPSEWVKMEELYQKYAADYELSTDREQVLKNICKTDLKMNQALDVGDIKTFKDLQGANDMLRKSGKFKWWTV